MLQAERDGYSKPASNDGRLEVVGFKSAYHAGAVITSTKPAVRLLPESNLQLVLL